jgi:SAM-dependent methyltransferase
MTSYRIGHVKDDPDLVREVNRLWDNVYPGLARQVAGWCRTAPRTIVEAGCFSGGTGIELLRMLPDARLTIACDMQALADSFTQDWPGMSDPAVSSRVEVLHTALDNIDLPEKSQDLAFCRGAFFFLDDAGTILKELYRLLSPGGTAVAGGGYGTHTPENVISAIAEDSREKNRRLGRIIVSVEKLKECVRQAGLTGAATVTEEGGLWAVLHKPQ